MNTIEMNDVYFSFGAEKPVLQGLNLHVEGQEILGLLGTNGSGKTTTFRILTGLLKSQKGSVKICGKSIQKDNGNAAKTIGYVPDESLLYPNLSAMENMNLFSILWGVERFLAKTRTEQLLHEVGLWEHRNQWVKSYSKGMKQKLSLCAALLHEPRVLILDEPFTGLDIDGLVWAKEMFRMYVSSEQRSIIFTSHTPEIVQALASTVAILKDGRIEHREVIGGMPQNELLEDLYKKVITPN